MSTLGGRSEPVAQLGSDDRSQPSPPGSGPMHLVGIGGAGMSGIARLLLARGVPVTGSDAKESPVLDDLRRRGARVTVGHQAENVCGAARVVFTAAVKDDNPELREARRLHLP